MPRLNAGAAYRDMRGNILRMWGAREVPEMMCSVLRVHDYTRTHKLDFVHLDKVLNIEQGMSNFEVYLETLRSSKFLVGGQGCSIFNFSMSGVKPRRGKIPIFVFSG